MINKFNNLALPMKVFVFALLLGVVYAIAQVAGSSSPEAAPLVMAIVGTPSAVSGSGGMDAAGIRRIAWDKKLRETKVLPSIFTAIETSLKVVGDQILTDKYGIIMRVDPQVGGSGQSVRLAMGRPFRKAPQVGTSEHMLNNEDERDLLWTELYYNEIKKAIKYFKYGFYHNDTEYLGWVESMGPQLTAYWQELDDLRSHQAILLGRSMELQADPINLPVTLNPNWIIPNLPDHQNPEWDNSDITTTAGSADSDGYYSATKYSGSDAFAENVAARMLQGSGIGSEGLALLTVDMFYYISEYIVDVLKLDPLEIDGTPTYVLAVPSRVKTWCMNPNNAGSPGEAFQKYEAYKTSDRVRLPNEFGRICENLILVTNHRAPTITVGGDEGSYTLNFGFVCPGENDDRNHGGWSNTSGSTNFVFDTVIVLGANALADYLKDPLETKLFEHTEYGKIEGRGSYKGEGRQIPLWDKDATARVDGDIGTRSLIYRGSAIIPVSRTPRVKVIS